MFDIICNKQQPEFLFFLVMKHSNTRRVHGSKLVTGDMRQMCTQSMSHKVTSSKKYKQLGEQDTSKG